MLILLLCFGATCLNLEQDKTQIILLGSDQKLPLWMVAGVYATGAWAPEDNKGNRYNIIDKDLVTPRYLDFTR